MHSEATTYSKLYRLFRHFTFKLHFQTTSPTLYLYVPTFLCPLVLFTSLTTEGRCVSVQSGPDINVKDILKTTVLHWRAPDTHAERCPCSSCGRHTLPRHVRHHRGRSDAATGGWPEGGGGEVGTQAEMRDKTRGCKDTQSQMGKIKKRQTRTNGRRGKRKGGAPRDRRRNSASRSFQFGASDSNKMAEKETLGNDGALFSR